MNATVNSINGQSNDFTHLTPDEQELIQAYRLGQAEKARQAAQKPESAVSEGGQAQPVADEPEASEESEIAAISAQFKQMKPKQRRQILDELWQDAGQPSPASKQDAPPAEPVELPEYVCLQIAYPLAMTLLQNVLEPDDVWSKYPLNEILDWMVDSVPVALERCDHVALSAYLKAS